MSDVYLVFTSQPRGVFAIHLDAKQAYEDARNVEGVVVVLPIAGDYRPKPPAKEGT